MQRFKNILCVIPPGATDNTALERAAALAENNQACLTVVDVVDEIPANTKLLERVLSAESIQRNIIAEHQRKLSQLTASCNQHIPMQTRVLVGIPFLEVIRQVLHHRYDLVIKTTDNGDFLDQLFGSDDMHLLRKCPCPVWLVKATSPRRYQRIVVAIDVDEDDPAEAQSRHQLNRQLLQMASSLALSEFAELHIVHAWEAMAESSLHGAFIDASEEQIETYVKEVQRQHRQSLEALVAEITNELGNDTLNYLKPQIQLLKGSPRKEIPAFTQQIEADLVIMGTVARTGIPGLFMGNTAETILNRLDCSVLAIKPPGFVTPVSY